MLFSIEKEIKQAYISKLIQIVKSNYFFDKQAMITYQNKQAMITHQNKQAMIIDGNNK